MPVPAKTTAGAKPAVHATATARAIEPPPRKLAARGQAADPSGTPLVSDTFTDATAPEFTGYNDACLSGATELPSGGNPPAGDHSLGGCGPANTGTAVPALYTGPVPPRDAPGFGYLELTNSRTNRTGAALFNEPIEASAGLDLSFETWQYGGRPGQAHPADGISFFLTDGRFDLTTPGAFGGSLGYAQKLHMPGPSNMGPPDNPGVAGGYLGVGLDVLGNYFANTEQRGYGCPANQLSPAGSRTSDATFNDRGPNMVTIRGPVFENTSNIDGYCYITATSTFAHAVPPAAVRPWPSTLTAAGHSLQGAFAGPISQVPATAEQELASSGRRIHIVITPAPDPELTVSVDFGAGPVTVLSDVPLHTAVPPTYRFGFAASTGDFTDIHLIRNVVINSDEPLPAGLELRKQVAEPLPGHLTVGDDIHYQFLVRNTGMVALTDLAVNDPKVGPVTCEVTTLDPDDETVCTSTYTVTAADVADGHIANTATAHGVAAGEPIASGPSEVTLPLTEPPGISVEKQVRTPGPYHAGQRVNYSYLVSNTGGIPLDDVHVTDDHVTDITCESTTLAPYLSPGYQTTCHGSYEITEHDAFIGLVINTATATGTAEHRTVTAPEVSAELEVGAPRLEEEKEAVTPGPHFAGSTVRYVYEVTNTGPRTFHSLLISDDHIANVTCDTTTLRPGQSTTCHGRYVVTAFDADAGDVTNEAEAEATDPNGNVTQSPPASETVPVAPEVPVTG